MEFGFKQFLIYSTAAVTKVCFTQLMSVTAASYDAGRGSRHGVDHPSHTIFIILPDGIPDIDADLVSLLG